jgi:hypothetical protein
VLERCYDFIDLGKIVLYRIVSQMMLGFKWKHIHAITQPILPNSNSTSVLIAGIMKVSRLIAEFDINDYR